MKILLPLLALVGLSVWLAARKRAQAVPDFVHVEKLKAFRQFEREVTEDARRRLALAADHRRVS
jgi:hypothetical protein